MDTAGNELLSRLRPSARRLGLFAVAAALGIFAYHRLLTLGTTYSFATGVEYWLFRPTDNTPLVVLGLSAWLVYRRWPRVRALTPETGPWWIIVPCLGLGAGFYLWAIHTRADDLQVFSLVLNSIGLLVLYWGLPALRALWLPIVFLLFAVPIPAPLLLAVVWKLQIWTAEYTGWLLYMVGVPALVSGDQILRATQAFQVVEGCSGLRSLETLTMLTILLIDLFRRTGWHAVLLVCFAPILAFFLNGLRVLTLILNPHSEIVTIHNLQGIAILLVGLLTVYFLDGLLESIEQRRGLGGSSPAVADVVSNGTSARSRGALPVLVGVSLLTASAVAWVPVWRPADLGHEDLYALVTEELSEWKSKKVKSEYAYWGSVRFGKAVNRSYSVDGSTVDVFVGSADFGQRGGSPLSEVMGTPGSGWTVRSSVQRELPPGGHVIEERVMEKGRQRVLLQHWYEGAYSLSMEVMRSLLALDRSGFRRTEPLLAIRLNTPLMGRSEDERAMSAKRLADVYERLSPVVTRLMQGGGKPSPD